jgi:hypothetical protein
MPGGRRAVQRGGRLRPERAAAVGGGRRTMYEDVRWFPGVPGAPPVLRHGDDDLAACVSLLHAAQALGRVGQRARC